MVRRSFSREDMLEAHDLRVVPEPLMIPSDTGNELPVRDNWNNLAIKFFGDFE